LAQRSGRELRARYPDLLQAYGPTVTEVDLGAEKGVWYRVYAGPIDSRAAAAAVCAEIKQRTPGGDCIVLAN